MSDYTLDEDEGPCVSSQNIADTIDLELLLDCHLDSLAYNHLTDVKITEDFIAYRDDLIQKYPAYGRSLIQRQVAGDALLAEYILPKVNSEALDATHMGHDIILHGKKIDIKVIRDHWFTVANGKEDWYRKCIHSGEVEYFAFFKYSKAHSKPFVAGDTASLKFIKLVSASNVMYNLRRSKYNGYYYDLKGK